MSITDLRSTILTRLGAPVINIELAPEQMDIQISDAVDKFIEVHYDGLDEGYIFLDVVIGTDEYTLPNSVHSVIEIVPLKGTTISDEPLLVNPFLVGNYYVGNSVGVMSPSVLDINLFEQNVAMWNSTVQTRILFEFNSMTHLIKILEVPTADLRYALRVHSSPVDITTIYTNRWFQKYSAALCKIVWGENIGKFEGATLPGGVALNYQRIIDEGKEEKEKLEEELYERYQEPVDFYFG